MNKSSQGGFSLYEILAAAAILFAAVAIIIPAVTLMSKERQVLQERVIYANKLHDKIGLNIGSPDNVPPHQENELFIEGKSVNFIFSRQKSQVKGCAHWINAKNKKETYCLYGYLEK